MKKYIKEFNMRINAGEAKIMPPLATILGQYNLNTTEFCSFFNQETMLFEPGLPIEVKIWILRNNKYDFIIKKINLTFLIEQSLIDNYYLIDILNLYKIFLIQDFFFNQSYKKFISTISGSLYSMQIKIKYHHEI